MVYDTIVIGGGVSGLMAAYSLTLQNRRVLVVERGHQFYERLHEKPFDVANGVGGSGLFSDGKLSLFPSATQLWKLKKDSLLQAYKDVSDFLQPFDIALPPFSEYWMGSSSEESSLIEKNYKSLILSKDQRIMIAFKLIQKIGPERIVADTEIVRLTRNDNVFELVAQNSLTKELYQTHTVIMAGGKHQFDAMLPSLSNIQFECFNRYEIGMRVECPNNHFDFFESEQSDVKLIEKVGRYEIRTFCCCKGGRVLESIADGFVSYNGTSSDFDKSDYSNIGFIVTIPPENIDEDFIQELKSKKASTTSLLTFVAGEIELISAEVDNAIRNFIKNRFPRMAKCAESQIYYPEFERFGSYPILEDKLQLDRSGIWLAGDSTGKFRGLLPSFVSGAFVAKEINDFLTDTEQELMRKFHIKASAVMGRKVVFAAQSKQWFYCRNAVCEYVFSNECIPVNPFRIFGYFLDDRVDRGLIRNGNNEMIARCDELWVFGPISDGVLFEIFSCIRQGKVVRFFNIATTANEIKEISVDETSFEPEVHAHQIKKDDLKKLISYGGTLKQEPLDQLSLFQ